MRGVMALLGACLLAAVAPLWAGGDGDAAAGQVVFPGWPDELEGRALEPQPLSEGESTFYELFPGRVARFSDGERQLVLRWLAEPSSRLHPASACFRGRGFEWEPRGTWVDGEGLRWGQALAIRGDERLLVRELVRDADGRTFADVSAWYWAALLGETRGPWWAVLVGEAE